MKGLGNVAVVDGECSPGNPNHNEAHQRRDGRHLWNAIRAINEVLNDAEKMDAMLDAASDIVEAHEAKLDLDAEMRIRTLDFGGRFADVAEQLKRMDLGDQGKTWAVYGHSTISRNLKIADQSQTALPYPDNGTDFELYTQKRREWCDRWLENKRVMKPDFDGPDVLLCRNNISRDGFGTWYLDSESVARNLGIPLRDSWEEVSKPDGIVNDFAGLEEGGVTSPNLTLHASF